MEPAPLAQDPPRLADDLADGAGADRRQLDGGGPRPGAGRTRPPSRACRRTSRAGPRAGWRCPSDTCRGGTGAPCRSRRRRAPPVPNANSSAPRSAAISRSRPVWRPPSVRSDDAVAQVVAQQRLVDLGEAQLPRRADVLDRRQRRGPGAARVAREVDVVGARLGDARSRSCPRRATRRASRRSAPRGRSPAGPRPAARGPRSSRCRGAAAG